MDIKSLEHASPAVSLALSDQEPFLNEDNGHALAQAIVDTVREPLLVCQSAPNIDLALKCAPRTGQGHRALLTVCRAW